MAKSSKPKRKHDFNPRIDNRRARHDYHIHEKLECGIVLMGSEVKAIRMGSVSLAEGFARVDSRDESLWLLNIDIGAYAQAGINQHAPKQPRKLLAHKREIRKLAGVLTQKKMTLVPLAMYFKNGRVKVEIGVAEGKQRHDKRQDIKKRDTERDIRRAMTKKRL